MIRFLSYSLTVAICIWSSPTPDFNNFFPCGKDNHLHISTKSNSNSNIVINDSQLALHSAQELLRKLRAENYRLQTVVIDPGHGGHDHGCSGRHSKEKNVALEISKKLGGYINSVYPEIKVIYTRKSDVFVPLYTRAAIANKNKADLFISVHCNAISTQKELVRGTETYVMGVSDTDENLAVAKRENEAILMEENYQNHYDGFDPNSPEGHIILSMFQNAFLEQSILFAEKVEHNFKYMAGRKSRGVKQAGFVVLKKTAMPSVLIESGYLTNSKEEKFLNNANGQDELANAIFRAFQSYKNELEAEAIQLPAPAPVRRKPEMEPEKIKEKPIAPPRSDINPAEHRKYFTVQIASSSKPLDLSAKKWKKVKFLVELRQENGNFKYLAGNFNNLKEAKNAQQKMRSIGFKDAFIVAYKGNKRIKDLGN